jgi:hypothetical protein
MINRHVKTVAIGRKKAVQTRSDTHQFFLVLLKCFDLASPLRRSSRESFEEIIL